MKVLVIGKGAREHALVWRLNQSETVWGLYCAGGNPGIAQMAKIIPVAPEDVAGLIDFVRREKIDLTVVGPESPLAAGIVDEFAQAGLKIFGPSKAAAQLEASKAFAKQVMRQAGVRTAVFEVFHDPEAARRYVRTRGGAMVVKADGLALGKGVVVCSDAAAASAAIDDAMERRVFGAAGARVVIEERLSGEEVSFFALCDGDDAVALGTVQDHKAVWDGDRGPNTGGMGAYTPVPRFGPEFELRVMDEVVRPTLAAMRSRGAPFRGVMFVGLMAEGDRLNVLEYNVRFGDPECEALMMRFEGDLAQTLFACAEGRLADAKVKLSARPAVAVVLASGGYPGEYRKGIPINGLERIEGAEASAAKVRWALNKTRVKVFHAGTANRDGGLVTDGGRVMVVTATANDLRTAVDTAYEAASMIDFEGKHMRRDIAHRALQRLDSWAPAAARLRSIDRKSRHPSEMLIDEAISALRAGYAVVYPTETFYALGVDALSTAALERLFAIKGREPGKPVALIAADAAMAFSVAREVPDCARRLADAFWPGPLTILFPARDGIPAALIGPDGGVGVRVSPHPVAQALSSALASPLTATSANLAGQPPAVEIEQARESLGGRVKFFVEAGRMAGGAPSTLVTFDRGAVRVLRAGAVSEREIRAALQRCR
jgi:phosphoribosylamine--glycine ligase